MDRDSKEEKMAEFTVWQLIQQYGLAISGIVAGATALIVFFRKYISPLLDWIKTLHTTQNKIDKIFYENTRNGGDSIKDAVLRIDWELNKVNERQKALLSNTPEAHFETDENGNYVWVNRTFTRKVQRTPVELYGHGWQNAVSPEERADIVSEWYAAVQEDREVVLDFHFQTPLGEKVPARVRSYKMKGADGKTLAYFGSIEFPAKSGNREKWD